MTKRRIVITLALFLSIAAYTKLVWQSGFDAGADVMQCLIATFQKEGEHPVKPDLTDPGCQRAGQYENNPLWALRRRGAA